MYQEQVAKQSISGGIVNRIDHNPTVEDNINEKIRYHESEIERLKSSKETMAPLLKMRIRDIQQAMSY